MARPNADKRPAGLEPGAAGRRGFSLVELMLAIAVVATLVGLLVPAAQYALLTAKITQVRSDLHAIQLALQQYAMKFGTLPPTRQYCLTSKRDLHHCLPPELVESGCLDVAPPDPFSNGQTYRYKAVGWGYVNDSPTPIALYVPGNFPKTDGDITRYGNPETDPHEAPVRWLVWSVGPGGGKDFVDLLGFKPENPKNWYPHDPEGIICRYWTGGDWRDSP